LPKGSTSGLENGLRRLEEKTHTMSAISRQEAIKAVQGMNDKALAPKKQYLEPGRRY
jgi:hypothetical protein